MKTLRRLLSVALATSLTLLAASCAKDESSVDEGDTFSYTIEAVADGGADTKTTLGSEDTRQVFWTQNDKIGVYQGTTKYEFTATEGGAVRSKLTYSGTTKIDESKAVYAIYPSTGTSFDGKATFTATVAAEQTAATSGTFSDGVNVAVAYASSIKTDLNFRNAVSFLKVGFKNVNEKLQINKITVETLDGSALAGTLKITPSTTGGDPTITVSDGTSSVSLSAASGSLSPDVYYYIAVIPGATISTKGYKVSFTTASGVTFSKDYTVSNAKTIARNQISKVGKKNLNNFSADVEAYWRVTDSYPERTNESDLLEGDYLLVKKTTESSTGYRVFDESNTDPKIHVYNMNKSGKWSWTMPYGTAHNAIFGGGFDNYMKNETKWSHWVSGYTKWFTTYSVSEVQAPDIIGKQFLYSFRNAFSDSGLQFYSDSFILNPENKYAVEVKDDSITFNICNLPTGGAQADGRKSTHISLSGCTLESKGDNSYLIDGTITEASVNNLLYIHYLGKSAATDDNIFKNGYIDRHPKSEFLSAGKYAYTKDDDNDITTRIGFCEDAVTTNSYVSKALFDNNGLQYTAETIQNCFMFYNFKLCAEATPTSIWLYKKGTKPVSYNEYISMFLSK